MILCFEPMSAAILACALAEFKRQRASVPRARVWLRRSSETILDAIVQETTEPLLDITNVVDPRVLVASVVLLALLRVVLIVFAVNEKGKKYSMPAAVQLLTHSLEILFD